MNISPDSMKKIIPSILGRYHAVIFVVIAVGGLAVAVMILNNIIQSSTSEAAPQTVAELNASFDQDTIRRIEKLKTSTESTDDLVLPPGRINPFVE